MEQRAWPLCPTPHCRPGAPVLCRDAAAGIPARCAPSATPRPQPHAAHLPCPLDRVLCGSGGGWGWGRRPPSQPQRPLFLCLPAHPPQGPPAQLRPGAAPGHPGQRCGVLHGPLWPAHQELHCPGGSVCWHTPQDTPWGAVSPRGHSRRLACCRVESGTPAPACHCTSDFEPPSHCPCTAQATVCPVTGCGATGSWP